MLHVTKAKKVVEEEKNSEKIASEKETDFQ